jgi:hypothetical protein
MDNAAPSVLQSRAHVATPNASRYLQQLCKHFRHARPTVFDETTGEVAFDDGTCHLTAEGHVLSITVTAGDEAKLARLQEVIARHLVRFAFREALTVEWRA